MVFDDDRFYLELGLSADAKNCSVYADRFANWLCLYRAAGNGEVYVEFVLYKLRRFVYDIQVRQSHASLASIYYTAKKSIKKEGISERSLLRPFLQPSINYSECFLDYFSFFRLRPSHPVSAAPNAVSDPKQYLVFRFAHSIGSRDLVFVVRQIGFKEALVTEQFHRLLVRGVLYADSYRLVQMPLCPMLVVYTYVERRIRQSELGSIFVVQHLYGFLDNVYDIIIVSTFVIRVILAILSSVHPFCWSLCIWRRLDRLPICILSLRSLSCRIRLSRLSALSSRHC